MLHIYTMRSLLTAQPARHAVDGTHPQYRQYLPLHERLPEVPEVTRHVPHGDQAADQRERPGELVDHEGVLGRELILGGADVVREVRLDQLDLRVDAVGRVAVLRFDCRALLL